MVTYKGHTYSNGNVPKALLRPLDGENYGNAVLRLDAADSWNRARAEVREKTGIVLTVRGWNRTYQEQVTFYEQRHEKWTPGYAVCCYWNGVPYRFTGTAHASPPGKSNHGWGLAVDVVDFGNVGNFNHPRRVASIAILKKHGWTDDEGRGSIREPWHLVYDSARDTQKNSTPQQEEPDMDATQAGQLRDVDARTEAILEKLLELHAGTAPKIDATAAIGAEKITMRTAIKETRLAVTGNLVPAVTAAVTKAVSGIPGVDPQVVGAAAEKAIREALEDGVTLTKES